MLFVMDGSDLPDTEIPDVFDLRETHSQGTDFQREVSIDLSAIASIQAFDIGSSHVR